MALLIEEEKKILFGQDIHGPYFLKGSNVAQALLSLQKLVDLRADILCEGHFGIYQPAAEVKRYIEGYLRELRGQ
jgi:glyoxylase-like metal-dependent hydrolase (beta-lactamase superfamily II)